MDSYNLLDKIKNNDTWTCDYRDSSKNNILKHFLNKKIKVFKHSYLATPSDICELIDFDDNTLLVKCSETSGMKTILLNEIQHIEEIL